MNKIMTTINPYLNFNGNTEEAFNFYKSVFGGELSLMRFKDTPDANTMPESDREKVLHVALPIGRGNILMGSDALGKMGENLAFGNNFAISISAESEADATNLFNGLAAGGQITMPLADAFWGALFGILTDKFGIQWMVNYDRNQPQ